MEKTSHNELSGSTRSTTDISLLPQLDGVKQQVIDGRFVKHRSFTDRPIWKRFFAKNAAREKKKYDLMQRLGVPCPEDVRLRVTRSRFGLLEAAEISMQLIPNTIDLRVLATDDRFAELRRNQAWRRRVAKTVASWLRYMHAHNCFLCQLHFGNVLVEPDPVADDVRIYFIDNTKTYRFAAVRRWYLRCKEVAYLYRDARQWCSLREQIAFMHEYLGRAKLSRRDRGFMRRCIRYAMRKWGPKTSLGHPVDHEKIAAAERLLQSQR